MAALIVVAEVLAQQTERSSPVAFYVLSVLGLILAFLFFVIRGRSTRTGRGERMRDGEGIRVDRD